MLPEPARWPRRPPVEITQQVHGGRDEQHADQRRVHNHRDRQTDTDLLNKDDARAAKGSEHDCQEQSGAGNQPAGALNARGDRLLVIARLVIAFFDTAEQENLVVH